MSLILQGLTSGSVTLQEPAVAGTTVITLPAVIINRIVLAYAEKKSPDSDELVMKFLEDSEKEKLVKVVNEKYKDSK